jgi:hypothetical protein
LRLTARDLALSTLAAAILVAIIVVVLLPGRDRPAGEQRSDRKAASAEEQASDLEARLERLRSLPYTSFTEGKVDPKRRRVVFHDPTRSYKGYNVYASRVGADVQLIDMDGRVVHRWSYPSRKLGTLKHAVVLENGDAVLLYAVRGLQRLDWNSHLLWSVEMNVHHEVTQLPDGSFLTIIDELTNHRGLPVLFPAIVHLSSDGEEIDRWSGYEHMDEMRQAFDQRSFLDTIIDSMLAHMDSASAYGKLMGPVHKGRAMLDEKRSLDYFHMNTVALLPDTPVGRQDGRFREGNLLVCFRNVNQIAVMDRHTKRFLWVWGEGVLEWPHQPTMLDNGNILIFDNGIDRKYSRVLELNPLTQEIEWQYVADPPESFYTPTRGSAQRFPNGNTLIAESNDGRVFEVTSTGEIVWEWLNPDIRRQRRSLLYRMMRLPPEMVEPFLNKDEPPDTNRRQRRVRSGG